MSAKPLAASSLGLSQVGPGGVVYGVVDGFLAQIQLVGPRRKAQRLEVLFRHEGEGKEQEIRRALFEAPETKASGIKAKDVVIDSKTVRLTIRQGFLDLPDEKVILARVRALLAALAAVSSPGPQTCRSCGSASPAEVLVVKGVVDRLCPSCVERIEDEIRRAAAEYESRTANLPVGFVYALVAGAAGGAIYGGVMIATNRMLWMLAILTGVMVGYAAVKGAGKGGAVVQGMAAVVTVISVLAGLLAFIGYAAEQHLAAQGKAIDWALFLARSPQILISAREDSLFSLAGGIFGAVYAIKRARHPEFVPLRSPEKSSAGGNLLPG
ncbi:MAG: hypothetical protein E6J62_18600 [Deltaproteobacteria bacterium]|nr:MAG: hypothetical protein E6J62_18600 [Deltaproteobacteria bacterium]TMB31511.1 MAG: hypothetical protein E6J61_09955 [Deltaproteobacteria bacterium]